jgi:hypothetical protein
MLRSLFLDLAYFSDAKITFGMFGMIAFVVDSQTNTMCSTSCAKLNRMFDTRKSLQLAEAKEEKEVG